MYGGKKVVYVCKLGMNSAARTSARMKGEAGIYVLTQINTYLQTHIQADIYRIKMNGKQASKS